MRHAVESYLKTSQGGDQNHRVLYMSDRLYGHSARSTYALEALAGFVAFFGVFLTTDFFGALVFFAADFTAGFFVATFLVATFLGAAFFVAAFFVAGALGFTVLAFAGFAACKQVIS